MFSYISFSKFSHGLQVSLLAEEKTDDCLNQISKWIEEKWGYLINHTEDERKEKTRGYAEEMYLLKYDKHLIGMFRLCNHETLDAKRTLELTHVYIDESMRHAGIGGRLIECAKEIAKSQGADLIVLETLNPNLNNFYQKHGASVVCEHQFAGYPSELLKMRLTR